MRMLFALVALCGALTLGACSDATLNKITAGLDVYDHSVDNFNTAAARIDQSIAKTSASLAKYCTDAVATGNNLVPLVSQSNTAKSGLISVTTGITTWCEAPPTNIGTAISSMAAVVASARQAYVTAKNGG